MTDPGEKDGFSTAPPALMVIFGAGGDLTRRLLLPSLYNLIGVGALPETFALLGASAEDWDDGQFQTHIRDSLQQFWGAGADASRVSWLASRAHYLKVDFKDGPSFDRLNGAMAKIEEGSGTQGNRLFYLAVAPDFIATIVEQLHRSGSVAAQDGRWRRVVVEKPFGHDLESAITLNKALHQWLQEDQIYRIDHFAGKDSVQDLAVFRWSNAMFEPIWNRANIKSVQITVAETVALEGRAGYYEKSGALRDMVPNHLAEMLSMIAMEPPVSLSAEHIRSRQSELLEAVKKLSPEEMAKYAVRGQYGEGQVDGKPVRAYLSEPGVANGSKTETYVALRLEINNWRWAGVPFYLRTGKALVRALTEVVINFREAPVAVISLMDQDSRSNQLVFELSPTQGIRLRFASKAAGAVLRAQEGEMTFQFAQGPFGDHAHGYEALLHDVMAGNPTLFQSADFVQAGWGVVQPVLDAWTKLSGVPLEVYPAGSSGPKAADDLVEADGNTWHPLENR